MPRTLNPRESAAKGFELNSAQRAAVEHGEGPLLVVAGAGTGKTRVTTERIRHLLESDPSLSGENILGLTFTDKAAHEMKSRVVKAAGDRAKNVWLSTFHSFCLEKILRPANPNLQALDDIDHWILLRRHIAELELKHFRRLADPGEFLNDFVKFFSRCQDELVTPADYDGHVESLRREYETRKNSLDADARKDEEEELARQEELARAYRTSERLLRERHLVTFGAQLMQAVQLLQADPARLEELRRQYRYILVDEFQDTNIAQLDLLWLIAGGHRNIVAVGDDDQAIYRFRGASFGSFTIFLEKFCGASRTKLSTASKIPLVSLTQNYRSTQRILRVAHEVISHNEKSPLLPPKNLSTENPDGEKIRVVEFVRPEEEAEWVASEIERLHSSTNPWRNFAVLYRKHTHRARLLEALQRKSIPFVIWKFSILSSTLIRDLLAYLRLMDSSADNVSCARVLAAPYWGVEPRDLVRLAERAEKNHRRPLLEGLDAAQRELPFSRGGSRVSELLSLIASLRLVAKKSTASGVLEALIAALTLAPLPSEEDRHYLDRFVEFVKEWEKKSERKTLHDFIQYLNFFSEAGGDIHLDEALQKGAVQLMTVHAAKGLEFSHVFILHVNKREFPSGTRPVVFEFPPKLMKEEQPRGDFQVQEERRLFYVALTRARQRLTLSTIVNKRKKPSPFLEDFLRNGKIQKFDTVQAAPKVIVPPAEETAAPAPDSKIPAPLFGDVREASRAYSHIALWAKAYHPPLPEPLALSASGIETYESCPMKYLFGTVWKIRGGPHASMTFGNVMHTSIKEFIGQLKQGRKMSLEDLMAVYDREWSSAGFPDEYQEEEYRREGREQLEKFHRAMCAAPPDVLFQEKTFELPLEHEIVVTGRMDQVNRLAKGKAEIVDYKTGKPKDAKKADGSLQLSVYALAAQDVLDLEPARLVFYNLTSNEPVATERDAKSLEKTKQKISEVADQIRAGDFPARPGFLCGYCDYKPLCPAHEQLISIRPAATPPEN
jgi:DNA helicase-2/ATP-dependent DNA helicase PcrA